MNKIQDKIIEEILVRNKKLFHWSNDEYFLEAMKPLIEELTSQVEITHIDRNDGWVEVLKSCKWCGVCTYIIISKEEAEQFLKGEE